MLEGFQISGRSFQGARKQMFIVAVSIIIGVPRFMETTMCPSHQVFPCKRAVGRTMANNFRPTTLWDCSVADGPAYHKIP